MRKNGNTQGMLHPGDEQEAKEFGRQVAKVSANLHDIPRELFWLSPGVRLVLIDPEVAADVIVYYNTPFFSLTTHSAWCYLHSKI